MVCRTDNGGVVGGLLTAVERVFPPGDETVRVVEPVGWRRIESGGLWTADWAGSGARKAGRKRKCHS